jgi:hypothetical protein
MMTDEEHKVWRAQLDAAFTIARRAIEEMQAAGCSNSMIAEVLEHSRPPPDLNDKPVEVAPEDMTFLSSVR